MEIIGKIEVLCDLIQGETAAGPWCKKDVVIATSGDNTVDVCVTFFGERHVNKLHDVKVGDLVQVFATVKSRQSGEKWFTSVEGNGITVLKGSPVQAEMQMQTDPEPPVD